MKEQWKLEADQRQYILMENQIRQFSKGELSLSALIAGLDALLQCLHAPEQSWADQFRRNWGLLEEVYAVSLHRAESLGLPNAESLLREAASQRLIEQSLDGIHLLLMEIQSEKEQETDPHAENAQGDILL